MDEFQERALGQISNELTNALRDLSRKARVLQQPGQPDTYNEDQLAAANAVIAALVSLDEAFEGRTLSNPLECCPCCTDPNFVDRLLTTPRDHISEDDMFEVVSSLTYTLGSIEDANYFAPRFFADGIGMPIYDLELAFIKVQKSRGSWSDREKQAVSLFLKRQLDFILITFPQKNASGNSLAHTSSFLNCAAQVGLLTPSLMTIKSRRSTTADARLLEFLEDATWINTYGSLSVDHYRDLGEWLADSDMVQRVSSLLSTMEETDVDGRSTLIKRGLTALRKGSP